MEVSQHSRYFCEFCGKYAVKRKAVGIWGCKDCGKVKAGGAYTLKILGWVLFYINAFISSCVLWFKRIYDKLPYVVCRLFKRDAGTSGSLGVDDELLKGSTGDAA
ncbi:hypothetical protein SAY86_010592 [Trapa natans]|uniref:60S ribosomal protein l37a n=1 Tax=Trapa natans TaxID=22666 RepID=A0AAN7LKR7_TRANT|nr:hypothetical protein SAY86_010592 [Trapa natans]